MRTVTNKTQSPTHARGPPIIYRINTGDNLISIDKLINCLLTLRSVPIEPS